MEIELNLLRKKIIEGKFQETLNIFENLEKKFRFFSNNEIMHLNARVNKFNSEKLLGNESGIEFNKLMETVISIYDSYILKLNEIIALIFDLKKIGKYDTALCELKK